jgi:SAM-dependent methyltransferase
LTGHSDILRCRDCGHGYATHQPTDTELVALYQGLGDEAYGAEEVARQRTARHRLRVLHGFTRGSNLVDVGCATGIFLQQAAQAGWKVTGVEPSIAMFQAAVRRLGATATLVHGPLQTAGLRADAFDVVTLWDVLEHVAEPCAFLKRAAALVRASGFVVVNVPNVDSLPSRLLGQRWPLLIPEHLHYFSLRSLQRCGEYASVRWLRVLHVPSSYSIDFILHRLSQHGFPATGLTRTVANRLGLGRMVMPAPAGDMLCVGQRVA